MSDDSDNPRTSMGGNSGDQLRGYVTRIERLEAEIAELNDGKKEVYGEVRACGFDKKVIRKLIARRRKDAAEVEEDDALLDLYEAVMNAKDPLD